MTTCVRKAWLVMGSQTIQLEDPTKGYFCQELDLGYPEVRDVVTNRPDQDGIDDRTRLMGSRAVTAQITAVQGAGAQIDAVAASFAPFMVPSQRPTLHYILDRPGAPERVLTLRAANYAWPIAGDSERDIQLAWVAADPVARATTTTTSTAWSGASTSPGRTYNFQPSRVYPPGGGGRIAGFLRPMGDVPVWPLYRIYGPITAPYIALSGAAIGQPSYSYAIYMVQGFIINAGQWVDFDSRNRTAFLNSDPTQPVLDKFDWSATHFGSIQPNPYSTAMSLYGSSTTGASQVQAIWTDGYLT